MKQALLRLGGAILALACMLPTQAIPQGTQPPFRMLFIGALSGPAGPIGKFELVGFQAGVDDVNSRGGILGRRIELTSEDSAGQGTRAVSILQEKLSTGPKPDVVVAGAISNETLALLPVTTQNKIITVAVTGTQLANNPSLYPYNFQGTLNYNRYTPWLANYLKGRGYKKIGLLTSNDANGQATAKSEKDGMEKAGLTVVWETFAVADLDLTAPMQRIADAKPDAFVFATLLPTHAPLVLEARYKVGYTGPSYADVNLNGDPATLVPADRLKNVFVAHMKVGIYRPVEQRSPLYSRWLDAVLKLGAPPAALLAPAFGWDNVQAVALAYREAGSMDPDRVKAAFEELRLPPERERSFIAWKAVRYTPSDHFNTEVSDDDFQVVPLGPRIDGAYRPGN